MSWRLRPTEGDKKTSGSDWDFHFDTHDFPNSKTVREISLQVFDVKKQPQNVSAEEDDTRYFFYIFFCTTQLLER